MRIVGITDIHGQVSALDHAAEILREADLVAVGPGGSPPAPAGTWEAGRYDGSSSGGMDASWRA